MFHNCYFKLSNTVCMVYYIVADMYLCEAKGTLVSRWVWSVFMSVGTKEVPLFNFVGTFSSF